MPTHRGKEIIAFAEDEFHPMLVAEVKKYCEAGGFLDPEGEMLAKLSHRERTQSRLTKLNGASPSNIERAYSTRRPRRLASITFHNHARVIYKTATALHVAGERNILDLRGIRDVITPQGAAVLADSIAQRLGPSSVKGLYAAHAVKLFPQIAKRCGVELTFAEHEALRELKLDLLARVDSPDDVTEKNLARLRQFDDPTVFCMLVALPDVVMAELESARRRRGAPTLQETRSARAAIAIDLLNTLPIRRESLATLDLERNFLKPRGGVPLLTIYPDQEKSRKTLETALSTRSWRLISLYRNFYRPILLGAERSTYLFPGSALDGHMRPRRLADAVCDLVRQRLGVEITLQLWRHVMSTKLGEKTNRLEDAQQLLGHVPGSRATRRHVRLGTRLAAKSLRRVTDEARPLGVLLLRQRHRAAGANVGDPQKRPI